MSVSLTRPRQVWQHALLGALLALSVSSCVVYERGPRAGYYGVAVTVAPPAPQVEAEPVVRAGYVWSPGYWSWSGGGYVWVAGRWLAERPGYHWVPAHWVTYNGGWRFVRGHWEA
jgi:hypothetical protein